LKKQHFPNFFAVTPASLQTFWDVFRLAQTGLELWTSAAATITLRQQLWLTTPAWDPRLAIEWNRMVSEKMMAGMEVCLVVQRTALDLCSGVAINPWVSTQRALLPLQRRTQANARRLSGK
jgi:hypothetical protein